MDTRITHGDFTRVMDTLRLPNSPFYRYHPGQYAFVHTHAAEHNGFDYEECCIVDVSRAPLEIVVCPCNHPERTHVVAQDKLSAPVEV